jgi:hypothetical protein
VGCLAQAWRADVKERDKENEIGLGKKLVIEDHTFGDLDEIIAKYVRWRLLAWWLVGD